MNSRLKLFFLLLPFSFFTPSVQGQELEKKSSADVLIALNKLETLGSVLYIAAHPDDENTRLLPYLVNGRYLRTGYLSLTRGDGGQNLIGKEQGESLGLLRTHELLAARNVDGAEQFFTRANDFGFSKNPEETFAFWNKDSILSDVVQVIRQFKPDVIICRFPTTGEGGHGHHTASAILAMEAFEAAADPTRFSEQLKFVQPWKTERIFWNTFNFGSRNTTAPDQLQIDVGAYNAILGKSHGELASESRTNHKSQGFGTAVARGEVIEYFKWLKGSEVKSDLFENIQMDWNRFGVKNSIAKNIEKIIQAYNPQEPSKSVAALIQVRKEILALPSNGELLNHWRVVKLEALEELIMNCSGLWIEASAGAYNVVPGDSFEVNLEIVNQLNLPIEVKSIHYFDEQSTIMYQSLLQNKSFKTKTSHRLNEKLIYSNPYWLKDKHTEGLYTVKNKLEIGKPQNDAPLKVEVVVSILGEEFKISKDLMYKYTDPVKGELYRPIEVLPPVCLNLSNSIYVFGNSKGRNVQFLIKANRDSVKGKLNYSIPKGWVLQLDEVNFNLGNRGEEVLLKGILTPNAGAENGILEAYLETNYGNFSKSIQRIEYDHIPYQFILTEASARLVKINLENKKSKIGYIPGSGDEVPVCLEMVGFEVTELSDEMLLNADLSVYDAIISGVRAYNTNERLQIHYEKLMTYVKLGGNLIVQYNTNNRLGPVLAKIGPYPFTISRNRVTDEFAEISFLDSTASILNYPNKITQEDFKGWVQERGIYFATELDAQYKTIFSLNDVGEAPSDGSLIYTPFGKGNFVYTGISFFRELPAGVPGAYRLFVNLINMPKNGK